MSRFVAYEEIHGSTMKFNGFTPMVIDDSICFATRFEATNNIDPQMSGGASTQISSSITGAMSLFTKESLDDLFQDDNGIPHSVSMDIVGGGHHLRLDHVLLTYREPFKYYETCNAASVEFVAQEATLSEGPKRLNTKITI